MGNEWTKEKIGKHADVFSGFAFKSNDLSKRHGVPVVKIKNVKNKVVSILDTQFFPEELLTEKHSKFLLQNGDILIAMTGQGSVGRVGRLTLEGDQLVLLNQRVGKFVTKSSLELKFLYYVVSSQYYEEILFNAGLGSGQPNLSPDGIRNIEIPVPPIETQKNIAHILGSLDSKIELNRKMNSTLESMAQALFKSWFVDFDPVIDKALAAGNPIPESLQKRAEIRRQLGDKRKSLPADIENYFPSSFVLSEEMGWIPEGWEVSSIGEETQIVGGGTPSTKNPDFWIDGHHPWVTPKDLSALYDKVLLSSNRFLTTAGLQKISSGLLPKYTVLMSSRAPVGYLVITQIETAINQGFIAMKCKRKLPPEYVIQWADSVMDTIKQVSSGSTFAEISKRTFRPFKIIVPSGEIINAYKSIVTPIYLDIADNVTQNKNLSELRDLLLPKLISGEIRVGES